MFRHAELVSASQKSNVIVGQARNDGLIAKWIHKNY